MSAPTRPRIAVLGGGTAGMMAALHVSRALPEAELLHIRDPRRPTIGVGLASNPALPLWCDEMGDLPFAKLEDRCDATIKLGGLFDGWGTQHADFIHWFQPTGRIAYHFDPALLSEVLSERIAAEQIYGSVAELRRHERGVTLLLDSGDTRSCDYVFDARGFSPLGHADTIALPWIPTNAALVLDADPLTTTHLTRNIARPHGWIFSVPLRSRTQYGYVHNNEISTAAEVTADFDTFLHERGVSPTSERRYVPFPSFVRRTFFDGAVFHIGNANSFIEPLEAVSIGSVVFQLRAATLDIHRSLDPDGEIAPLGPRGLNKLLLDYTLRNSMFIGWHYCAGSPFTTPFWQHAARGHAQMLEHPDLREQIALFHAFVGAGREFPVAKLAHVGDMEQWKREIAPLLRLYQAFGAFSELNFAQVGAGLGCFA